MENPRILLIRLSAVGDVVDVLPAAQELRRLMPKARLAWAVERRIAPMLEGHPALDELLVLPRHHGSRGKRDPGSNLFRFSRFLREVGSRSFDAAVDLHGNLRSGLIVRASKAPLRIGFARPFCREGNHLFTNVHVVPDDLHRTARALSLLRPLGVEPRWQPPDLRLPPRCVEEAAAWRASLAPGAPAVILHPGASRKGEYKRWFPERYAELSDRLEERGVPALFSWGRGEEKLLDAIAALKRHPLRRLPPSDLLQLAAIFQRADLVVGADSGPMHIAYAVGCPTLTIFGPKSPEQYGPYRRPERTLYHPLPCSPCRNTTCPHRHCLQLVTVDEVLERILKLLG